MDDSITKLYPDQDYHSLVESQQEGLFEDEHFSKALNKPDIEWLRPHQISTKAEPEFVVGNRDRFDVNQGELGDCWFLASLANLVENRECFDRVVPQNQDFKDNYKGIFRFRFFRCLSAMQFQICTFFTDSTNGWRLWLTICFRPEMEDWSSFTLMRKMNSGALSWKRHMPNCMGHTR